VRFLNEHSRMVGNCIDPSLEAARKRATPLPQGDNCMSSLPRGNPYLIANHNHHEQKIKSQRPENEEFKAFKVPPRDKVLLCLNQLIVFERRENQALFRTGDQNWRFLFFHHKLFPLTADPSLRSG